MTSAGDLLSAVIADLAGQTIARRPAALADEPDAVHQLRTAVRRQRNLVAAFRRCFDTTAASGLGAALASYGGLLGECRDLEVRAADARTALAATGLADELGPAVIGPLEAGHAAAHAALVAWHAGPGALALDALLERWTSAPPLTRRADRPAEDVAVRAVRRQVRRVLACADAADAGGEDARHALRKAGRRLRHTADAVTAVDATGDLQVAGKLGQAVQGALGDHRDALLLADHVRRCATGAIDPSPYERVVDHADRIGALALDGLAEPLAALRAGSLS